jgi:hypothetical protein
VFGQNLPTPGIIIQPAKRWYMRYLCPNPILQNFSRNVPPNKTEHMT